MKAILYTGNPYYSYVITDSILASIDLANGFVRIKKRHNDSSFKLLQAWEKVEFSLSEETEYGIRKSLPEVFL